MDLLTARVLTSGQGMPPVHAEQVIEHADLGLLAVADAPSGRAGQALPAKRIALDAVATHIRKHKDVIDQFRESPAPDLRLRLLEIVEESFTRAAQELYAFARRYENLRITLDVVLLVGQEAFVGHVGDGRVLLVRGGLVHQLTVDHNATPSAQPISGEVVEETSADQPKNSVPGRARVRALGPAPSVEVESMTMETVSGDRFIVSTPHLYSALAEHEIQESMLHEHLQKLEATIVGLAPGRAIALAAAQLGGGEPSARNAGKHRLALLAPMPMFTHCSERELREIAGHTTPRRFAKGSALFRQGDLGTELYLLISGQVDIVQDGKHIVTLKPGSNFGEMAMLDEPTRSAGAIAAEDCELLVISRDSFFSMLRSNPMLAVKILWNMLLTLSSNLRRTSQRLADVSDTPAIAMPEEESIDLLGGFGAAFEDSWDEYMASDDEEIVGLETTDQLDALEEEGLLE